MPSMPIKDGDGVLVEVEVNGGDGTALDPYQSKVYAEIIDTSLPVTDNGGSLTVDGTVAVSNATFPVTDNGGSLTVDGTVTVQDGGGSLTVDGTITVEDGGGSITIDGSVNCSGDVGHGSADSGSPVKVGGRGEASLETTTLVDDGDRTEFVADLDGVQVQKLLCPFGDIITERVTDTAGNSTAFTNFGAGGAGVRNYITTIALQNTSGSNVFVDLRDGTAGSVLFTIPSPAGGGCVISFPVPFRQATANTALAFDVSGAATTIYISMVGFQSKL